MSNSIFNSEKPAVEASYGRPNHSQVHQEVGEACAELREGQYFEIQESASCCQPKFGNSW
jgi:hypothetical protein